MPLLKSPTLTLARLAANRRNALKSTGPRTAAGKRRAALNAPSRDLCPQEPCGRAQRNLPGLLLPPCRFGTTAGTGDEPSQTNPRGLTCLLSIRYARKARNKPKHTNRHLINSLQPFLPRFRRKMYGLLVPYCGLAAAAPHWSPPKPGRALPANPRCLLESTDSSGDSTLLRFPIWAAHPAILRQAGKRGSADLICRSAVRSRMPTREPQT